LSKKYENKNWQKMAEEFEHQRSAYQIYIHFQTESNKLRNKWTVAEDNAILDCVKRMRMGNYIPFSGIADMIPGRNSKQIAQRWRCHLDPSICRGNFTPQEDILLYVCRGFKKLTYHEISEKYIPRNEPSLRNRYNHLKRSGIFNGQ
jgi:hypothetical protein